MQNVTMKIVGTRLVIEIDLAEEIGPSKSGKTILIASTEGNVSPEGRPDVKVGLNVYRRREGR